MGLGRDQEGARSGKIKDQTRAVLSGADGPTPQWQAGVDVE